MVVAYRYFYFYEARRMWLNSDTLEKCHVTNIYCSLTFRVLNHDMPGALEKTVEVSEHISEFVIVATVFRDVNSVLYTVTSINSP